RGVFDHDDVVLAVHDVSLRLRRAAHWLLVRLRRRDRGDYSGRADRTFGETIRRDAAGDRRGLLLCDQFVCGSVCRAGCGWTGWFADWWRRVFTRQLARDAGAYESRVEECPGGATWNDTRRDAIGGQPGSSLRTF